MALLVPTIHPAAVLHSAKPLPFTIATDLEKAWNLAEHGEQQEENLLIVHPSNPDGLETAVKAALQWIQCWRDNKCLVAVDVETSSLEYFSCKLYSIALCGIDPWGTYVSIAFTLLDYHTLPWEVEQQMVHALQELLADPNTGQVFHNAPYDQAVLRKKGFKLAGKTFDTLGAQHLIQPDGPKDLGWIGHTYLETDAWKISHQGDKLAYTRDPIELLVYNAKDADRTARLVDPMSREVLARGMSQKLIDHQMECADWAAKMEMRGLPVNHVRRRLMGMEMLRKVEHNLYLLRKELDWPDFNPMSSSHKADLFYGEKYSRPPYNLGIVPTRFSEKTQEPSTSYKAVIDFLENRWVRLLVDHIELRQTYAIQYKETMEWEAWKLRRLAAEGILQEDVNKRIAKMEKDWKRPGAYQRAMFDDGRLHPKVNPCGQKGSRQSTQPNCYDAETEVLTENGWMLWPQAFKEKPRLLQYDATTGAASLAPLEGTAYISFTYTASEAAVSFKSTEIDLRVTEDHRMLYSRLINQDKRAVRVDRTEPAGALVGANVRGARLYTHAKAYKGSNNIDVPWPHIAVLCACQADGWRRRYGNGEAWAFYFSKPRKIERLTRILTACGEAASWYSKPLARKGRKDNVAFYLRDCPLKDWIDQQLGPGKHFGPWLLSWPHDSLKAFAKEAMYWDGRADHACEYASTVKGNADWVQVAAILTGVRIGAIREFWGSQSKRPCYITGKGRKKLSVGLLARHVQRTPLKSAEQFYCATVPTGYLFVRRNGKACISGNCQNQRPIDTKFIETRPGRVMVGIDKDQLELRIAACLAGVGPLLREMRDPNGDPHTMAAREVWGEKFTSRPKEEQKGLRDMLKNVVYAALYSAGVEVVWRTIRERKFLAPEMRAAMTLKQVKFIYHSYFGQFPEFPQYHQRKYEKVQHDGYLLCPSPLMRKRMFPVWPAPFKEISNWDVQTFGSDIVNIEGLEIQAELEDRFHDAGIILHKHDELVAECDEKDAYAVQEVMNRRFGHTRMEGPKGEVFLTGAANIGYNLHAVKKGLPFELGLRH